MFQKLVLVKYEEKYTNQFVYSWSISFPYVHNIAANYKTEVMDRELVDKPNDCKSKILERAANILISDIENVEVLQFTPIDPRALSCVVVSEKVSTLLKHFLKGTCGQVSNKGKTIRSIAQDIIPLHSNSEKIIPKNIRLDLVLA